MTKVAILQTDNRLSLDYLLLTQKVNKKFCDYFNYNYNFIYLDNKKYNIEDPRTAKIYIVNDFLLNSNDDVLVFLDSDAWIQNGSLLNELIKFLMNDNNKHGCFSRDPYVKPNTFINSGSFIIKNNEHNRKMYRDIIKELESDISNNVYKYWEDQYYIGNYIFNNKDKYIIFVPDILNTPFGQILRHNWCKSKKMFDDLEELLVLLIKNEEIFKNYDQDQFKNYYDTQCFPNLFEEGYEYFA